MKTLTLLTAFILLLFGGCKKEPLAPQLPPYTQEGKNIFACKINGEVFIAKGVMDNNTFNPKSIYHYWIYSLNDTLIFIYAKEETPVEASVSLKFIFDSLNTSHELNQREKSVAIVYLPVDNYVFATSEFATNSDHKGWVQVKYFQNNIMAGTFEFTAIDNRGEVIHVTDGRFDISTY